MFPFVTNHRFFIPTMTFSPNLRHEVDETFGQLFGSPSTPATSAAATSWSPSVAIWNDDKVVSIELDLPGVDPQKLEVQVERDMLRIRGERRPSDESRKYSLDERQFGQFERLIKLPEAADTNSINAEMQNGVLSIRLSRKPEDQPRKVTIQSS